MQSHTVRQGSALAQQQEANERRAASPEVAAKKQEQAVAQAVQDGIAKQLTGEHARPPVGTDGHARRRGDREQVAALATEVQQLTGSTVELAYVDQGYTGSNAASAAQQHRIQLEVIKHPMAKRGFVLLPRRWVVKRSFAWAERFRRLARVYVRPPQTLRAIHFIAFAILMTSRLVNLATS